MIRSLPALLALSTLLDASGAMADEHARRTALLSVEAVYDRAPSLELLGSRSCGFFCGAHRYLGLNQAGAGLRIEYRERRSRRAGVRLTGRLGWTYGWWLETHFETGIFGPPGEREGQEFVGRSSMMPMGLAFGPVLFVKRTAIAPALSWDGVFRLGDVSFSESAEETSYVIPRAAHVLGMEVAVDHRVGARTRLIGAFRIGGVTGTGDPFDLAYRVTLGVTVDLRPTG